MDVSSPPCRETGPHSPEWNLDTPGSMLAMVGPRLSVPTPPSRPVKSRLSTTSSLPSDVLAASSYGGGDGFGYGGRAGGGEGGGAGSVATATSPPPHVAINSHCDSYEPPSSEGGEGFDRSKFYNMFLREMKNLESTMQTRLSAVESKCLGAYRQAATADDVNHLRCQMQEMRNELEDKQREQDQHISEQRAMASLLGSDVSALQASKRQHVAAANMMSEIFESVGGLRVSLSELSKKREESDTALWRLEQSTTSNQEALAGALRQLQTEVLHLKRAPSVASSPAKSFLNSSINEDTSDLQKELDALRTEVKSLRKDVEAAPWRETVVTVLSEMQSELLGINNRNEALDKRVADEMSALKSSVSMASTACATEEKSEKTAVVKPMSQDLADLKDLVLQEASKQQTWARMFQSSLESTSSQVAVHEEKLSEVQDILGHQLAEQHDKICSFGHSISDLKYATEHLLRQDALKDNALDSDEDDEGNVATPRPRVRASPDKRKLQKLDDIASVQEVLTKEVTAISTRLAALEKQKSAPLPAIVPATPAGRPHSTSPPGLGASEEATRDRHRLLSASTLAAASSPHMSSTCPPTAAMRQSGIVRNIMVPKLNLQHGGSPNSAASLAPIAGGAATVRLPVHPAVATPVAGSPAPRVTRSLSPQGLARTVPATGAASRQTQALSYIPTGTSAPISTPVRQACATSQAYTPAWTGQPTCAPGLGRPGPTAPAPGPGPVSAPPPGLSGSLTPMQPLRMATNSSSIAPNVKDHNVKDVNLSATSAGTTQPSAPPGSTAISKVQSAPPPSVAQVQPCVKPRVLSPAPSKPMMAAAATVPAATVTVVATTATPKTNNQRSLLSQVASTPALPISESSTKPPVNNTSYQRSNSTVVFSSQQPSTSHQPSSWAPLHTHTHTHSKSNTLPSATRSYLPPPAPAVNSAPSPASVPPSSACTKAAPTTKSTQTTQPVCTAHAAKLVNATFSHSKTAATSAATSGIATPSTATGFAASMLPSRTPPAGLRFPTPVNKQTANTMTYTTASVPGGITSTGGISTSIQMQLGPPPPISPQRSSA